MAVKEGAVAPFRVVRGFEGVFLIAGGMEGLRGGWAIGGEAFFTHWKPRKIPLLRRADGEWRILDRDRPAH